MTLDLPSTHHDFGSRFFTISLVVLPSLFFYLAVIRWIVKPMMKRRILDVLAVIVLLSWLIGASWVRTHTGLGLLVLKGARPWMVRAEKTENPEDAKAILRWIQESGQYGVNAAEDAVRHLPDPHERARMYHMLSDCAINDGWRDYYLIDAEREEAKFSEEKRPVSSEHP